ncbi:MAG: lycopene cyclase domain-containing protein [Candidatus Omnitrophota bacterium]|nr:MAG: lycopene cyclase domain-containing protein [Candidatus Omnitrophota bacterium]
MKEYTLLAVLSVFGVIWFDFLSKVRILRRKIYYFFLAIILFFKFLVNGYLTAQDIVTYNNKFFLGVKIGSIPLEDFLFGFSMITLTIILWEWFKAKIKS